MFHWLLWAGTLLISKGWKIFGLEDLFIFVGKKGFVLRS